ncbi:MAG TPA: guanylate kinase [Bacteroidales bacterium]|nr:guanylate kinase [Bacteroidales bacterium]
MKGKLVIISAPSGAGKTTIVKHLMNSGLNLSFSVSATTRPLRGDEKDGTDYFFLTVPEFKRKIENDELVEWQEVYKDLFYGTLKSEMERIWKSGKSVLFDVDVKGGINLKNIYGNNSLSIFVMPPSIEALEKRLLGRGTDSAEKIKMRVEKAAEEINLADNFDRIIINDNLEKTRQETFVLVNEFLKGK